MIDSRKRTGRFLVVAILAAGVLGYVLLQVFAPQPVLTPREEIVPLVEIAPLVWSERALEIRGEGVVRPRTVVALTAQVTGEVLATGPGLERGGVFEKGDVLVNIDARAYSASVKQLRGDIEALRADLRYARQQVARLENLRSTDVASESDLEQQISVRDRLVGQIAAREAQLARAELDNVHTKIVAPFDGKVFSRDVDVGDVVQPGGPLAQIFATDLYEVVVQLNDDEAALIPGIWQLRAGETRIAATVVADFANGSYAWPAQLVAVEGALDRDARTVNVVVHIRDPDQPGTVVTESGGQAPPLVPGMYARVALEGLSAGASAIVPRAAVHPGPMIWTLDGESRMRALGVSIAFTRDDEVAVIAEDRPGDRQVVLTRLPAATDGLKVRATASSNMIRDE